VTFVVQAARFFLFVDPDPVVDSFDLFVVDFSQENVFEAAAAQNPAMTRIQFEPNRVQHASPTLRSQVVDDSLGLDKLISAFHDVGVDDGGEEIIDFPFVGAIGFLVLFDAGSQVVVVEETDQ